MRTLVIVDGANVVGSRPDGWWRDRHGAAVRLRDQLVAVALRGLPDVPPPVEVVLVVEGAARGVPSVPEVRVAAAPASGDDLIVRLVTEQQTADPETFDAVVVVTADRQLRERVRRWGAQVRGPRWLTQP
ncbi:hypothetical protein O7632_19485 [Solwaraspora sp. WMMD406]|uniref:hypothetical protein n=1 Tax=Solwaraspora sp. WMMD406 TaxID=3016095 RepID=UPI002416756F|nr:hypothetical protein [Solwaraspora sp. WMMD406]MDG4766269.1 hypothetical protein [Solwaraspora sp. WMMD406]